MKQVRSVILAATALLVFGQFGSTEQESLKSSELRASAELGDVSAQYQLALKYVNVKDYNEAMKWFRLAAEQGYAPAQYVLGATYYRGQVVTKDIAETVKMVPQSS